MPRSAVDRRTSRRPAIGAFRRCQVKGRRFISVTGVVVVAMVAAAISFRHQSSLAGHNGQPSPWEYIYQASIDGLIATTAALIATDRASGLRPRTWAVF